MKGYDPPAASGPIVIAKDAGGVTVTNTIVETSLFTQSIAGSLLGTVNRLRLTTFHVLQDTSGIATGFAIRFKYGGTVLASFTVGNSDNNLAGTPTHTTFCVQANGAAAQEGQLLFIYTGLGFNGTVQTIRGTSGIDSTVAQNLEVTFQWASASAVKIWTTKGNILELLR